MAQPLPPVPGVNKVQLFQTIGGDTHVLTHLFYQHAGAPTAADAQHMAEVVRDNWVASVLNHLNAACTLDRVVVTDLTSVSTAQGTAVSGTAGSAVTAPLPAGTAMVISTKIPRRFRGGHPRMYVGGLSTGDLLNAQKWLATALTNIQEGVEAVDAAVVGAAYATYTGVAPVTVSYFSGFTVVTNPISGRAHNVPKLRVGGPQVDFVNDRVGNPNVGSQRRRNLQSS
jgi:hypothetical protein